MMKRWMHKLEVAASTRDRNRTVRPFEWGLEFLDIEPEPGEAPADTVGRFVDRALADSRAYYAAPPLGEHEFDGERLSFPSAVRTRWERNNVVQARYLPAAKPTDRAVIILPQWNADAESHMALGRILARFGISALRLSLPYHDVRMPEELVRADYMVSSNVGRTLQACRQAVLDVRHCVDWLESRGYTKIGITGTSIGSCMSFLAYVHDQRIRAGVFNHVSSYFADVVWTGISTRHVRMGLEGSIGLEDLRRAWLPISPNAFVPMLTHEERPRPRLLVTARYDLTFLPYLSDWLFEEMHRHGVAFDRALLRCGHYTLGRFPFNYQLGYLVTSYMHRSLA